MEGAINGLIADLEEHFRSKAPRTLKSKSLFDKIAWLVDQCEPPYSLQDIDDYLIECQIP